jgi:NhaP-type Na+/H+ or K+/H+ antiporter
MFQAPWLVVALFLFGYAAVGLAVGAATGWLISRYRAEIQRKLLTNALLGSLGFVAGFFGCALLPWPQNAVVKPLFGGATVATTMSRYQQLERAATVIAVVLPLAFELFRRTGRQTVA